MADVARARAATPAGQRIGSFRGPGGRRFWLKQVESHSLRGRLTKGPARRGFENDRQGLHVLARAGLPVAPIVAEGADYFVMADAGPTLHALLQDPAADPADRLRAFAATGAALAGLHRQGLCHGRPAVRDTCWDGETARFIDLERFSERRTGPRAFADDMLLFVFSAFSTGLPVREELDATFAAYFAAAPAGMRDTLRRRERRIGWLAPLVRGLQRLRPGSRELRSVTTSLDYIAGLAGR